MSRALTKPFAKHVGPEELTTTDWGSLRRFDTIVKAEPASDRFRVDGWLDLDPI